MNGSANVGIINNFSHFIICKRAQGAACPIIQVVDEDVKLYYYY